MLARDFSVLQILSPSRPFVSTAETVGVARSGEDSAAGAVGRADGDAAGAGCEFGFVCAGYSRCGEDTDSEWECDGVGDWAGAEECGRWRYGSFEAAVVWKKFECIAGAMMGKGKDCMTWSLGAQYDMGTRLCTVD